MVIEESIRIHAAVGRVWKVLTDLTCWQDWNTVTSDVACDSTRLAEGTAFRFCLRPFVFPVRVEPVIEEMVPNVRVVWTGRAFGVFARHEWLFGEDGAGTVLTSRETFRGPAVLLGPLLFPLWRLRALTKRMLEDLRKAAESA